MNRTPKLQTSSGRKAALWGLVAVLALLLMVGAGTQGSGGAEEQGSPSTMFRTGRGAGERGSRGAGEQSPVSNLQSPISISYTYDAAGRLLSANYGGGVGITYSYDATGNLVDVAPGGGHGIYLPLVLRSSPSSSQAAAAGGEAATVHPVPAAVRSQAVISPTSSFVLYSRADNTIWLKDEAGHAKLIDGARPRLSPDGRYIVHQDEAIFGDLYVHDLQTGQATQVYTSSAHLLVASWTGNSSGIVFDHGCRIYGLDRDGSNLETLIDTWPGSNYCYNDSPNSNPVDGRLAWENEKYGLGVAAADGSNPYWITNTQPYDYSPRWSPDGQWIAFWRKSDAYKIRPDGTDLTQLTFLPAGNWLEDSGQWAPDGKYLVAAAQVNGVKGLYAVSTDGSGQLFLVVPREWEDPDWVGSAGNLSFYRLFLPLVLRSSLSP